MARALCRLITSVALALALALPLVAPSALLLGVGEAWTLVAVVRGILGAVAMRLAVAEAAWFWLRRDEFRRKLNLDMRGDDEMVPSP